MQAPLCKDLIYSAKHAMLILKLIISNLPFDVFHGAVHDIEQGV